MTVKWREKMGRRDVERGSWTEESGKRDRRGAQGRQRNGECETEQGVDEGTVERAWERKKGARRQ